MRSKARIVAEIKAFKTTDFSDCPVLTECRERVSDTDELYFERGYVTFCSFAAALRRVFLRP